MEMLSDIVLKKIIDRIDRKESSYCGEVAIRKMATELLSARMSIREWEEKEKYRHDLIMPLTGCCNIEYLVTKFKDSLAELATLKESTRWVPVEEGNVPRGVMLEVCNAKTQTADLCMYGSITWVTIQPTHYRKPLPLPPVEEGK